MLIPLEALIFAMSTDIIVMYMSEFVCSILAIDILLLTEGKTMDPMWRKQLEECGVDVNKGINAHMGNEAMFERILKLVVHDENFDMLFDAMGKDDAELIFDISHSLKGTLGNVGLTSIDSFITDICEITRKGSTESVHEKIECIKEEYDKLMTLF